MYVNIYTYDRALKNTFENILFVVVVIVIFFLFFFFSNIWNIHKENITYIYIYVLYICIFVCECVCVCVAYHFAHDKIKTKRCDEN